MLEEGNDFNLDNAAPPPPPAEESSNRSFLIVAGILGGVVLISLVCMVIVWWTGGSRLASSQATQTAISVQNVQMQGAMTATAEAALWTPTLEPSPLATETETPVPTSVVAIPSNTPTLAFNPLTATMAALKTQVAIAQLTPTSTLVRGMPTTGIADEVGLPGLVIAAIVLVAVILLVRRLRASPTR